VSKKKNVQLVRATPEES